MFLHCAGWSLEDLFGRTVTTQCHLAEQSNVWVYQVSCSALEYVGVGWVLRSGQECGGTLVYKHLEHSACFDCSAVKTVPRVVHTTI